MTVTSLRIIILLLASHLAVGQPSIQYLAEGFDDNKNNWIQDKNKDYSFSIEDGHLVIHAYTTSVHAIQNVNLEKESSFGMHSRMIFFNGTSEGWMGIRFGMSDDAKKYITFCYNNAQGFLVSTSNGKKYQVLRQSKSTVVKPYDYNTLTVVKTEDNYKFLINDKQVFQDEIKNFYGPKISLYTSNNMSIRVDEVQIFDPKKGKQKIIATQAVMAKTTEQDISTIISRESNMPADFKEFYEQFGKYGFPYDLSTVINQGKKINSLPFVQKNFYQYDLSTTRNHNVWALSILSVCQSGYTFLVSNQYTINSQDITKFEIVAFDNNGKQLGRKDIGFIVAESGRLVQTLHFRVSQSGSAIMFNVEETYSNGNVNKKLVSYNGELCNLNAY